MLAAAEIVNGLLRADLPPRPSAEVSSPFLLSLLVRLQLLYPSLFPKIRISTPLQLFRKVTSSPQNPKRSNLGRSWPLRACPFE